MVSLSIISCRYSVVAANREFHMTDKPIELDLHRGMAAQQATDSRRLLIEVEDNERILRLRRDELESHLTAVPAANWREAVEKARYIIRLYTATLRDGDTQRRSLVDAVLADFERLDNEN
jgi:hypothetical protein